MSGEKREGNDATVKIVCDTHVHTIASTHAYSTVLENAQFAASAGIKVLAITDHAPTMPDAPHIWHFGNMDAIPDTLFGVRILKGIEANVCDYEGGLDMDVGMLRGMDWVIASMHEPVLPPADRAAHTRGWIGIAQNPMADLIGHPESAVYEFDHEAAVRAFKEYGKAVELNEHSFALRPGAAENCLSIAGLCKKYEVPVVVNSDAHFAYAIGQTPNVLRVLAEIRFPEKLVLNADADRFLAFQQSRKAARAGC